jgi:hypothetical protein
VQEREGEGRMIEGREDVCERKRGGGRERMCVCAREREGEGV